jgi:dnd system-associated protein 4
MAKSAMRKSEEYEFYFQELGNRADKIFDSMKDVFMMAVAVGFRYGQPLSFAKSAGENIALDYFNDDDKKIMDLVALSVTDDISILLSDDDYQEKKYKLIEEYANGGMKIMVDAFCKTGVDTSELYKFVEAFEGTPTVAPKADITDIIQGALNSLEESTQA